MPSIPQIAAGVLAAGTLVAGGSLAANTATNPYTSVNVIQNGVSIPSLAIAASSTVPDAGTVQTTVETTQPEVMLSKWSGQVNMGVTYEGLPATTTGARPFMSQDVDWNGASQSMQVVPLAASTTMEDGGMEINIILNSEPATNTFDFAVSGADDLDFYYQPPLWQDAGLSAPTTLCTDTVCNTDGQGTSTRPENIVGSYAVYYLNHANHIDGQTNYATGKAYQIFRPLVTDSSGTSTWAALLYSDGVLTVTVPQTFLNTAVYPVTIDPTFGYTTIGGTKQSKSAGASANASEVSSLTAGANQSIIDIQIYSSCFSAGTGTIGLAPYTIVSTPSARVGSEVTANISGTTNQWYVVSDSQSLTNGTTYNVAFGDITTSCSANNVFLDTTSGTQSSNDSAATGALPSTWAQSGTSANKYSVFADYTTVVAAKFAPWQFSDF